MSGLNLGPPSSWAVLLFFCLGAAARYSLSAANFGFFYKIPEGIKPWGHRLQGEFVYLCGIIRDSGLDLP